MLLDIFTTIKDNKDTNIKCGEIMNDLKFLKDYQYAHRGLFNNDEDIPENSTKAFSLALEHSYAIELDIQPTKDDIFVCFHDKSLNRMCNINNDLYNLNYYELQSINLLNSCEIIPKFTDILDLVDGKVPLLIEVKAHKNFKKNLKTLVTILDNYDGKFAVFSFDPNIIRWFKKNKPSYIRGQITSYFHENNKMPKILKYLMKTLFFNKFTKPDFISYNLKNLPNKYATKYKNKGHFVFGYTARNQQEYDKVLKSYDNVVFENFIPKKK